MNGHHELELQVGGTVNPRTSVYIVRPADDELFKLLQGREYANVLCSRQMGKSSLLIRTKSRLAKKGYEVAAIDVAGYLGSQSSADEWYQGLLDEIICQLHVPVDVNSWWKTSRAFTPNQKLLRFFRDEVLPRTTKPIVIFLDEIDGTLKLPYTDDFFVAIRAMYNDRAREPLYNQITFCLVGVASPNELIKEGRTTPYNIGRTIELEDFDPDRDNLGPLFKKMGHDQRKGELIVRTILKWTGGHPYLTLSLCERLLASHNTDSDVEALVNSQFADLDSLHSDVHFQQVLRFLDERVEDKIAALALYRRICSDSSVNDHNTPAHIALKLTGLVKRDDFGRLVIRNRIYARIFSLDWVSKALAPQVNAFERLLGLLAPDRDSAAKEYERLRQNLVRIFILRGMDAAEDLADETLDRVVDKLETGININNLQTYCYGVAQTVLKEHWRRVKLDVDVERILSLPAESDKVAQDSVEQQARCLERCLQKLRPEQQKLVLEYYSGERTEMLEFRKKLAGEMGVAMNALRIRAFRIRQILEECIRQCVDEANTD